jgi:hypothetical protein
MELPFRNEACHTRKRQVSQSVDSVPVYYYYIISVHFNSASSIQIQQH